MHLHKSTTLLTLATVLLFLTTLTLTSPTGPYLSTNEELEQADSISNITSIYQRESTSAFVTKTVASPNGDGNHIIITLEPGVNFETCAPNKKMPSMCTLTYVEKSTWGGWGELWVYDNECNWMGANDHVARNWLAARWSLASKLRWFVDIRITNAWTEKQTKGVEIWYGNHYLEPFYRPLFKYSAYVYLAQYASKTKGDIYAVPGQRVTTILEPGDTEGGLGHPGPWQLVVDTCGPNTGDWTMCTVTCIEKSTWGGWGVFMLYDNWCNRIGYNDHVARNWLASTYLLSSAVSGNPFAVAI
ncbi:hypothetical protein IFR05_013161 [Cadophora sp. M221]|nr:hypothetical protein IFR05_013161 [Cadophora sp. M221]